MEIRNHKVKWKIKQERSRVFNMMRLKESCCVYTNAYINTCVYIMAMVKYFGERQRHTETDSIG